MGDQKKRTVGIIGADNLSPEELKNLTDALGGEGIDFNLIGTSVDPDTAIEQQARDVVILTTGDNALRAAAWQRLAEEGINAAPVVHMLTMDHDPHDPLLANIARGMREKEDKRRKGPWPEQTPRSIRKESSAYRHGDLRPKNKAFRG